MSSIHTATRRDYRNKAGRRLPGVTTVIGQNLGWNKRALMHWANQQGLDGRNHWETSQEAADIGTLAHAMVEASLKGQDWTTMVRLDGVTDEMLGKATVAFRAWEEWRRLVNFELVASEHELVSERYQVGGTIDVAAVQTKMSIVDIKTSNDIYPEHRIQVAAYGLLWNENYPDRPIDAYYIIRLDKHTGGFAYYYWPELRNEERAFAALVELHQLRKLIK